MTARRIPAGARCPQLLYYKLRGTVMYSVPQDQVSDAPEPIIVPMPVPLSAKQARVYAELARGVMSWLDTKEGKVYSFDAGPVLAQMGYLFQLCADARQLEISIAKKRSSDNIMDYAQVRNGFSENWALADKSSKIGALLHILRGVEGQVLVLTGFAHTAREVARDLVRLGYEAECLSGQVTNGRRSAMVERFHAKTTRVLTCTQAAWHGITLQAPTAVLYGFVSHVPGMVEQAIKRAWTMDDPIPVTVYDLFAPGTVEVWNRERLADKAKYMGVLTNGQGSVALPTREDLHNALHGVWKGGAHG